MNMKKLSNILYQFHLNNTDNVSLTGRWSKINPNLSLIIPVGVRLEISYEDILWDINVQIYGCFKIKDCTLNHEKRIYIENNNELIIENSIIKSDIHIVSDKVSLINNTFMESTYITTKSVNRTNLYLKDNCFFKKLNLKNIC